MIRQVFNGMPASWRASAKRLRDDSRRLSRHRKAKEHLISIARRISQNCLNDIHSLNEWELQRPILRSQLQWMLGLDPLPDRTPLNPTITGSLDGRHHQMMKLVFESQPNLLVTANYYLPKNIKSPVPCIIYLCGHWPHPLGAKVGYQERYQWYPEHGFALLVLDPLGFGEVPGVHHGTQNLNLWHWLSLGYTPAGVELWNAMRALDWLETQPEVDANRLGVTGISGGGVMSWFLAALDDRIQAAAPSCSSYTIGSQASLGLVGGQCDCTFYPNVFGMDFPSIGALIAPRPLLMTSGRLDDLFPPLGYREVQRRVKRIYDYFADGESTCFRAVDARVGHTDPPLFLRESRQWMQRWLMKSEEEDSEQACDDTQTPVPAASLACLNPVPSRAGNFSVHNRFISVAQPSVPKSVVDWNRRRETVVGALKSHVFGSFPLGVIPFHTRIVTNRGEYLNRFARFEEVLFDSESGAPVRVLLLTPLGKVVNPSLLVLVKRAADQVSFPDFDPLLPLLPSTSVLVLLPRFSEITLKPAQYAELERTAALTGRTIAAMQTWDVVRAVRWAQTERGLGTGLVTVYGRHEASLLGLQAALIENSIDRVILDAPPESYIYAPPLMTILRSTDIPEMAGALAPRTLIFLTPIQQVFELTRRIYGLINAESRFRQADSLAAAVSEPLSSTSDPEALHC